MYDCGTTVLLNVHIHLVFVGNGYAALVTSNLPRLRKLYLRVCDNVRDEYVTELKAAVPKVEFYSLYVQAALFTRSVHKGYLVNGADSNSANYK